MAKPFNIAQVKPYFEPEELSAGFMEGLRARVSRYLSLGDAADNMFMTEFVKRI